MTTGRRHWGLSSALVVVGTAAAFAYLPAVVASSVTAGLLIGKYVPPDQRDQAHVRHYAQRRFTRSFGRLAGALWGLYWWPLARLIPHRNFLSHLPPIGTAVAFLYLFVPLLAALWWLLAPAVPLAAWLHNWLVNGLALGILGGWALQDLGHLAQDGFRFTWRR